MSNTHTTVSVVTHNHDQGSSTAAHSSTTSHSSSASGSSTTHVTSTSTKAPPLSHTSTVQEIAAYIAFYLERGYTVTTNQTTFSPAGAIQTFRFEAARHTDTQHASVSIQIDAAAHSISTTESSSSTSS